MIDVERTFDTLASPLDGVSAEAWSSFVAGMATASTGSVSDSNALGMFEMLPRRLADLGLVKNLRRSKKGKRTIWVGEFVGSQAACDVFLRSPTEQYHAFCASMRDYFNRLCSGEIDLGGVDLSELSIAGALAILHRAGPSGLKSWSQGKRFPATEACYARVKECF